MRSRLSGSNAPRRARTWIRPSGDSAIAPRTSSCCYGPRCAAFLASDVAPAYSDSSPRELCSRPRSVGVHIRRLALVGRAARTARRARVGPNAAMPTGAVHKARSTPRVLPIARGWRLREPDAPTWARPIGSLSSVERVRSHQASRLWAARRGLRAGQELARTPRCQPARSTTPGASRAFCQPPGDARSLTRIRPIAPAWARLVLVPGACAYRPRGEDCAPGKGRPERRDANRRGPQRQEHAARSANRPGMLER